MAGDPVKLAEVAYMRDLSAKAGDVFDQALLHLSKMQRYGHLLMAGETELRDPITADDLAGSAHEEIPPELILRIAQDWQTIMAVIDVEMQIRFATFGRLLSQQ